MCTHNEYLPGMEDVAALGSRVATLLAMTIGVSSTRECVEYDTWFIPLSLRGRLSADCGNPGECWNDVMFTPVMIYVISQLLDLGINPPLKR